MSSNLYCLFLDKGVMYPYSSLFTLCISDGCNSFDIVCVSVCLCVCLCLRGLRYAPLQWYMGYLCTRKARYAPFGQKGDYIF